MKTIKIRITGPKGCGKSTVAAAITRELERLGFTGDFQDGRGEAYRELTPAPPPPAQPMHELAVRQTAKRSRVEITAGS